MGGDHTALPSTDPGNVHQVASKLILCAPWRRMACCLGHLQPLIEFEFGSGCVGRSFGFNYPRPDALHEIGRLTSTIFRNTFRTWVWLQSLECCCCTAATRIPAVLCSQIFSIEAICCQMRQVQGRDGRLAVAFFGTNLAFHFLSKAPLPSRQRLGRLADLLCCSGCYQATCFRDRKS